MSTTPSFTALGKGNGFPFCIASGTPTGTLVYDDLLGASMSGGGPIISYGSLATAMDRYWSTEYYQLAYTLSIQDYPSPGDSDSAGFTFTLRHTDPALFPTVASIEPRNRVCNKAGFFAANADYPNPAGDGSLHYFGHWQEFFLSSQTDNRLAQNAGTYHAAAIGEHTWSLDGVGIDTVTVDLDASQDGAAADSASFSLDGTTAWLNIYTATGGTPSISGVSFTRLAYTYV